MSHINVWPTLLALGILLPACGDTPATAETQQAVSQTSVPQQAVAICRIEPAAKLVALATEVPGRIIEIQVREGQAVRQGDVLIRLADEVQRDQLAQATARLATQQATIQANTAALAAMQIQGKNQQTLLRRIKALHAAGAETQQRLDDVQTEADRLAAEANRLEATLAADRSRLQEIQTDIALARTELARRTVRALSDGTILDLAVATGDYVSPEQPFGDFSPAGATIAVCEVDELAAPAIQVEQPAFVRLQGLPDTLAYARVRYAAPFLKKKSLFIGTAGEAEDRRVREVQLELQPVHNSKPLLYNSRVEAVISLKPQSVTAVANQ